MQAPMVLAGLTALALGASAAAADPIADATAGQQALSRGDAPMAVAWFTQALRSSDLSAADRESALVLRGQAYLAEGEAYLARDDAEQALALNPGDADAASLKATARRTPQKVSLTCQFVAGPKADHVQDFRGSNATTAVIGEACTDGRGSNGFAIGDQPAHETLTCEYFYGPKAGQVQDFRGVNATKAIVGGSCTDGQGSDGLGIPDR